MRSILPNCARMRPAPCSTTPQPQSARVGGAATQTSRDCIVCGARAQLLHDSESAQLPAPYHAGGLEVQAAQPRQLPQDGREGRQLRHPLGADLQSPQPGERRQRPYASIAQPAAAADIEIDDAGAARDGLHGRRRGFGVDSRAARAACLWQRNHGERKVSKSAVM